MRCAALTCGSIAFSRSRPSVDRAPRAADLLDGEGLEGGAVGEAVVPLQPADLHHLAAEPDQQHAPKFGLAAVPHSVRRRMSKPSPARAMPQPLAWVIGTTPSTFRKSSQQAAALGRFGDVARDRGRAVHAGQHADVVAHADLAVGAPIALKVCGGWLLLQAGGASASSRSADMARFWVWTWRPARCRRSPRRSPGRTCAPSRRSRSPRSRSCGRTGCSPLSSGSPMRSAYPPPRAASRRRRCRSGAGVPLRHHW